MAKVRILQKSELRGGFVKVGTFSRKIVAACVRRYLARTLTRKSVRH